MKYTIKFSKKALKSFLKLPKKIQTDIMRKVGLLAGDPYVSNNNIKTLQGSEDCYRLRIGDYRVLYRIFKKEVIIEVINIAHRREAYR